MMVESPSWLVALWLARRRARLWPARLAIGWRGLHAVLRALLELTAAVSWQADQVTVSFARSGGPGGQNVNKVNTKVDMRFKVAEATWLPEQIRSKLLLTEANRINKDGELVVSSTRTRTQKGNIQDALEKLQAIIDAAAYVPPPPSEETKTRIKKLAKIENERRLQDKRKASSKKSDRRSKGNWD
eukprot:SM000078S22093  [mRNA]  locus=s78:353984:355481:- [translate_table: standard]